MRSARCKSFLFKIYVRLPISELLRHRFNRVHPGIFDDSFIDYLFDLVEETRYMHDETFNYSVIKLIVSA